jgi:outer membrane protein TolC
MRPRATILACWLTVWSLPASAQGIPARLTLAEALALAREHNPEYRQALQDLAAAGANALAGLGRFLPDLSGNLGWTGFQSTRLTGETDFGEPVSLANPITFSGSSAVQGLAASLTVFDGLANVHTYRARQAAEAAARAKTEEIRRRVEAETTRRFYEVLSSRQLIAVEESLLAAARAQLANTERLYRAGGASREDVLGAQADLANQELSLARARGEAQKAALALKEALGVSEPLSVEPAGDLPPVVDPGRYQADSLVAVSWASHPRLSALAADRDAARRLAQAAGGTRWPTVGISASFSRSMNLSSYGALFEFNPRNRGFAFGVQMSWPLFRGFQLSAQRAQAEAAARGAEVRLETGKLSVERAVRAAHIDWVQSYRALALAEEAAALSRERLVLARERYALAALPFTSLQQIVRQASEAERQRVTARYQYAVALAALAEAMGADVSRFP